jgi:hypothetical protein
MTGKTSAVTAQPAVQHPEWGALLLGLTIFALLWILYTSYHEFYVPNSYDIPALADGLLLAPGARWQDWFTHGYAYFWNLYPEWPAHGTEFTRPVFQFVIFLAHFVLGRDWASYGLINCFAVAGMSAVAFHISRGVLGLRTGPSLIAAMLVVLSPPVLLSWLEGFAYAAEPLATLLVSGAFLAAVARRDFLCLAILFVALLTKETTVWAPLAAAITIMMRPKPDESLHRRVCTAAVMFLPIVTWLGLRVAFFGGIGGTYATEGYTPLADFLKQIFVKLAHMQYLFIGHHTPPGQVRGTDLLILDRGTAVLIYTLLSLWVLRILPEITNGLRYVKHEARWPIVDTFFLATLWAAIALVFYFAVPLSQERYATSVVMFAWPALVGEVERRRSAIVWSSLAVCCVVALIQSSYLFVEYKLMVKSMQSDFRSMDAALRQVPTGTRQIYVLSAGGLQEASPEYVRLILGVRAEIVVVAEISWGCRKSSDSVAFDYKIVDGVVNMTATLPTCADFYFDSNGFNGNILENGSLYRNDRMSYELPQAHLMGQTTWWKRINFFALGRTMSVHVRPNGPARFIIEHGGPNGIAWFDIP